MWGFNTGSIFHQVSSVHFESGFGFYLSESGFKFYQTSPARDFMYFVSGSGSYQGSPEGESGFGFYQFLSPGPHFNHRVRVRVRILSIFESRSGSGFYLACPGPRGSDSTNTIPGPYMIKTVKNLLFRKQEAGGLETWYTASDTQVIPNLFKW